MVSLVRLTARAEGRAWYPELSQHCKNVFPNHLRLCRNVQAAGDALTHALTWPGRGASANQPRETPREMRLVRGFGVVSRQTNIRLILKRENGAVNLVLFTHRIDLSCIVRLICRHPKPPGSWKSEIIVIRTS